ncbi:MAG: hypothetical protein JSV03_03905 [Planctomycetota bacterium]|nr:MAG: hypothetical protein JSV03_03905 [Planctomycetota bacterium]
MIDVEPTRTFKQRLRGITYSHYIITYVNKYSFLFWIIVIAYLAYACRFIFQTSFVIAGERYFCLFDDAMVSMRYAKNLAEGAGLVWNVDGPRVEGYTNPLWVCYMALLHLLGVWQAHISVLVQATGALCLVINLYFVKRIAEAVSDDTLLVPLASIVLTAFYYPLNNWGLQGTEVSILTLLTSAAVYAALWVLKSDRFVCLPYLLLGVAIWVRPDALVLYLAVSFFLLVVAGSQRYRHLKWCLLIFLVSAGTQTIFRFLYYGEILPNTYYLKMTGYPLLWRITRGFVVFRDFVQEANWILLLFPFFAVFFVRERRLLFLAWVFICQSVYNIYVGGDAWEWYGGANRYLSVVMPLFFIIFSASLFQFMTWLRENPQVEQNGKIKWIAVTTVILIICVADFYSSIWSKVVNHALGLEWYSWQFVGVFLIFLTLLAVWKFYTIGFLADSRIFGLAAILMILIHLFCAWMVWGIMTMFTTLMVTTVVLTAIKNLQSHCSCVILYFLMVVCGLTGVLARIDVLLFCLAILIMLAIFDGNHGRRHLIAAALIFAGFGALWLSIILYGGDSVLSKVGGFRLFTSLSTMKATWASTTIHRDIFETNWILFVLPLGMLFWKGGRAGVCVGVAVAIQLLYAHTGIGSSEGAWIGGYSEICVVVPLYLMILCWSAYHVIDFLRTRTAAQISVLDRYCHPIYCTLTLICLVTFNAYSGLDSLRQTVLFDRPLYYSENYLNVGISRYLTEVCKPSAKVAVRWAGAIPYFCNLPAIDCLGKNDKQIARLEIEPDPGARFYRKAHPGHMKWDYTYSLGELAPDVIANTVGMPPEAKDYLAGVYSSSPKYGGLVCFRKGSEAVLWDKLQAAE